MSIHTAPAGVAMKYNGFTFPTNIRTKVTEEPVQSGDNRTVKYSKLTISVSGFITQAEADALGLAGTLDATMKHIRRKLQVNGKNLVYVNKGYGDDLDINNANGGGVRDVAFGPKPGKFTWYPLGGAGAGCYGAGFSWEVTTFLAECDRFNIASGVFLEVSFTVTYDTDEAGLVTIVHAGTAQIPMSLRANNTIDRTVDDEIGRIIQPVPVGFIRRMSRTLSTDRATCTFTLTDKQVEVPYPQDVVFMDMKYRVKQKTRMGAIWDCSFNATIRLSPTAEKDLAWRRFFNIVVQRVEFIRRQLRAIPRVAGASNGGPSVVRGVVEVEEDLFKNESRLSMTFQIAGVLLRGILGVSGLWRPLVNAADPAMAEPWDADLWTSSLRTNAQSLRGVLGAQFNSTTDVIIDVCSGQIATPGRPGTTIAGLNRTAIIARNLATSESVTDGDFTDIEPSEVIDDSRIEPESSWVDWKCLTRLMTTHNQIRHKPLAGVVRTKSPTIDPFGDVDKVLGDSGNFDPGYLSTVPDIIQQTASPSVILQLRGFGIRIGHRVNPPKVVSFGGQPVTLRYEDVSETELGMSDDVKAYRTEWLLEYLLPAAPKSFDLPANPILGTDGEK